MDLDKLKEILVQSKIYLKDKPKNFLCKCPYCGDHKDPKKQGHLYVSKNSAIPVAHCWFCGYAVQIPKLISDLTGDKTIANTVISEEEVQENYKKQKKISAKKRFEEYKVPQLDTDSFATKRMYIRKRTNNLIDIEKIPGLVFNFLEFFKINNLDIVGEKNTITNLEADLLQKNFVGFLSEHNTTLYCRNCDESASFKFKKVPLQVETYGMLDYWAIKNEEFNGDIAVLTEGNFNALGEYLTNSLNIKHRVRVYASGNTYSYSSLLKSVCFDNSMFKVSVVILSDNDKSKKDYSWFLHENNHIIKDCRIYVNKSGKDFGVYPQIPMQIL